jgi:hypothetical protein
MLESLIRVLELIQPPCSLMRAADFIFGRGLVMDVHGMHGRVAIWLCGMGLQENGGANDGDERRYIDEMLRTK